MNKCFLLLTFVFLGILSIAAHGDEDFSIAEEIISQKTPCSELNDSQLEIVGDYYMELMHPGESHEYMDEALGGEGSESLRQAHISIAYRHYCGDYRYGSGMMQSGMMGYGYYRNGFVWVLNALLILGIIFLAVWLSKKGKKGRK